MLSVQGGLSNREVGKRFRAAVRYQLAQDSDVQPGQSADWLVSNGVAVAMRYSKRHRTGTGGAWFFGIGTRDSDQLASAGRLLLIVPEEDGHRFVQLSEADTKDLLRRCKGSERGDLKVHVRRDGRDEFRFSEWPDFPIQVRFQRLMATALEAAGVTDEMGLLFADEDDEGGEDVVDAADPRMLSSLPTRSPERVPRAFDATAVVTLTMRSPASDPVVTLARREQSHRAHQRLVASLDEYLRREGWTEVEELAGAIDLRARRPLDGRRVIFECKSLRVEAPASELYRCRLGLAQLLEYRFELGERDDDLCLVANNRVSERRVLFLEALGVACACFVEGAIVFLGRRAALLFGPDAERSR